MVDIIDFKTRKRKRILTKEEKLGVLKGNLLMEVKILKGSGDENK